MRKLTIAFALIPILSGATAAWAAWSDNLLLNPGAETGTMEGWIPEAPVIVSTSQSQDTGMIYPHSGQWFFNMGNVSVAPSGTVAARTLYQGIDVTDHASDIDAGLLLIHAATCLQTEDIAAIPDADYAKLTLRFLNQSAVEIDNLSTGLVQSPNLMWAEYTLDGTAPQGTRTIRFELLGQKQESFFINAYFDDAILQVNAIPEPATFLLLCCGWPALLSKRA